MDQRIKAGLNVGPSYTDGSEKICNFKALFCLPDMMRFVTLFVCLLLFVTRLPAQTVRFGNEWINYQQTYYKIPIAQPGLYRITYAQLQNAGLLVDTIDPSTIQLFHRGVEQAIHVQGEANKKFDSSDYIEFYGRGNDGTQDSLLYRPASAQPHKYYSLFSDSTAYFLTWRLDGKSGKRMATSTDTDVTGLTPEPFHWAEELRVFTDEYTGYPHGILSKIEYCHYETGEGWSGPILKQGQPAEQSFTLTNVVQSGPSPTAEWLLTGREHSFHTIELLAGSVTNRQTLGRASFSLYENKTAKYPVSWDRITSNGQLILTTISQGTSDDKYSLSYLLVRYPQRLLMAGLPFRQFKLAPNPAGKSLLELTDAATGTSFLDITDPSAPIRLSSNRQGTAPRMLVPNTATGRTVIAFSQPTAVSAIQPVRFQPLDVAKANYLIITHSSLMKPAGNVPDAVKAYASYRASQDGGSFDTLSVDVAQLFNQFSYGERHPLAIRRFLDYRLQKAPVQYLLLLGRGRSAPGVRKNGQQSLLDLVPTYGFPPSDALFSAGLNNQPEDLPAIPTGRVNAATPAEIIGYLNKVKEHESVSGDQLWRKRILHLSGGRSASELVQFRGYVEGYKRIVEQSALGSQVSTLSKKSDDDVEYVNLSAPVNEGVGFMTFFGHSSLWVTDLDIGLVSNDLLGYRNKGRYPMLLMNGCAVGNFFFGLATIGADWILTPNRGAVAVIAQSHLGFPYYLNNYTTHFYEVLSDSLFMHQSIGTIQQETNRRIVTNQPFPLDITNTHQLVLQGDPAVRLFPLRKPDYALETSDIQVTAADGKALNTLSDSVSVRLIVQNAGLHRKTPLTIRIRRSGSNGQTLGVYNSTVPEAVAFKDTFLITIPNDRNSFGINRFTARINPDELIAEETFGNNEAWVEVNLPGPAIVPLLPEAFSLLKVPANGSRSLTLVAQTFRDEIQQYILELDTTAQFTSSAVQSATLLAGALIQWKPTLPTQNTTYFWRVKRAGQATERESDWVTSSFTIMQDGPEGWWQRRPEQFARNTVTPTATETPAIGPAQSWEHLTWTRQSTSPAPVEIWGIDKAGRETLLLRTGNRSTSLSSISSERYPFLRLKSQESVFRDWQVAYIGVPEGYAFAAKPIGPTLQQGEKTTLLVNFTNLSARSFTDSVLVRYTLYSENSAQAGTVDKRMPAPEPGLTTNLSIPVETRGIPGQNQLVVTVNPQLQAEQSYLNNTFDVPFYVVPDKWAPVLEVSIDEARIKDGDVVSATPLIALKLTDENKYLIRQDTSGIDLYLEGPCEKCPARRINWLNPNVKQQANAATNEFSLTYVSDRLADGSYQLTARGRDMAGNVAPPYQVTFRVNSAPQVESISTYPNPFTDRVRISFQLSGSQAPDEAVWQITDINGRPIRRFQKPVRIGLNEWFWDGTDENSARVAPGMYLFRLTISNQGTDLPLGEGAQNKQTGKLILIR
ncbi:hypothetical protein GCM10023189_58530 [Nibrella saemangeumensis]|uniref:Gingipain domain-containing protein n=2 Tax=Nibrella saemangeumensis TaxID=1084526 RepID=A0ABP8NRT1_9BACT